MFAWFHEFLDSPDFLSISLMLMNTDKEGDRLSDTARHAHNNRHAARQLFD